MQIERGGFRSSAMGGKWHAQLCYRWTAQITVKVVDSRLRRLVVQAAVNTQVDDRPHNENKKKSKKMRHDEATRPYPHG
jgi:hypothetical protein